MKKFLIFALLATLLLLCACADSSGSKKAIPQVISSNEYLLYQNIFFNNMAGDYVGKSFSKEGVFTVVYDEFNQITRYYVWGYYDQTKCCDWQWELVLNDTANLPTSGSLVTVTGTLEQNENALDGYWYVDTSLSVKKDYQGYGCDIEMTTMSATLERVQLINMQRFADRFEGKTVSLYGRVYTADSLQHPYYDNAWVQHFATTDKQLPIGTTAVVQGAFRGGIVEDCTIAESRDY